MQDCLSAVVRHAQPRYSDWSPLLRDSSCFKYGHRSLERAPAAQCTAAGHLQAANAAAAAFCCKQVMMRPTHRSGLSIDITTWCAILSC